MLTFSVLVALFPSGGAGAISREFDPERLEYLAGLRRSLEAGAAILRSGGSAVDATVAAVRVMEEDPLYNAGIGSVLTAEGTHELDAAVMRGSDLQAGAVAAVRHIRNPVDLARLVLDRSPHVLLISDGAEAFATANGVPLVHNTLFTTPARLNIHNELLAKAAREQAAKGEQGAPPKLKMMLDHSAEAAAFDATKSSPASSAPVAASSPESAASSSSPLCEGTLREQKYGTVGAVCLDLSGCLASAISTGGMSLKSFGRVGDSPLIGCGFYANKHVAVACTGNGEAFMRAATAKDVACLMEYKGLSVTEAAAHAMRNGEESLGKDLFNGGLIAVDAQGEITMPYNSLGMYRGSCSSDKPEPKVGVWAD